MLRVFTVTQGSRDPGGFLSNLRGLYHPHALLPGLAPWADVCHPYWRSVSLLVYRCPGHHTGLRSRRTTAEHFAAELRMLWMMFASHGSDRPEIEGYVNRYTIMYCHEPPPFP